MDSKKFNELTKKDKDYIKFVYNDKLKSWDMRIEELKTYLGLSERSVRKWLVKLGCKQKDAPTGKKKIIEEESKEPSHLELAKQKTLDGTKKRFIITSAQNATPVLDNFFDGIIAYSKFINADVLVVPSRYKNPTSLFTSKDDSQEWWVDDVVPYLSINRHNLCENLVVLADVKIQPTASDPLQGMESITAGQSCIVPHVRMELRSIATYGDPKFLMTTGTCTKPNYTDSKAGKKGEFNHSYGFVIVEVDEEGQFYFRQVSANDLGEFVDLFYHVDGDKITKEDSVEALIMGDIHCRHFDPRVGETTFNDIFKKLYPKKLVIHDIIDSESISHHNLNNPFLLHQLEVDGDNSLQGEIDHMIEWLKQIEQYDVYIVKSNHDEHIDRFLCETDWRKSNIKNALPYIELASAKLKGLAENGIVPYIINKHFPKMNILSYHNNFTVCGKNKNGQPSSPWFLGAHGHQGSGGSRGSLKQFSKLTNHMVVGHSHVASRIGGACSVATSTHLNLKYLKGASAWCNAHGIINSIGKFQHIIFRETKDGSLKYTTLEY